MYLPLRSAAAVIAGLMLLIPLNAAAQSCEPDLPLLAVFSEHFANRGQARTAYHLAAKERALEAESCVCPYQGWSFADFIQERVGKGLEELTQPEIRILNRWADANGVRILKNYNVFYRARCAQKEQ